MFDSLKNLPWIQIIDSGEKLLKIVAIVVGAIWVYYKFFKGRTFKNRLEAELNAILIPRKGKRYLKISASLKNVGLSKIEFDLEGSGLRIFSPEANQPQNYVDSISWHRVATLSAFERHQWIESSERISDHWFLILPDDEFLPVKVELCIAGKKTMWYVTSIVEETATVTPVESDGITQSTIQSQKDIKP